MTTTRAATSRRLRAIYDVLPEIVLVVDGAGTILEAHMGAGFEGRVVANDLVGMSIRDVLPRDIAPITMEQLDETFLHGTVVREYETAFAGVQRFFETRGIRFDDDVATCCREVEPAEWGRRSIWSKCLEWMCFQIRYWL